MPRQTQHIDSDLVDKSVTLWKSGAVVAIPTETVYGLGADACNGEAVAEIYRVKGRPSFNPLIVHVADAAMAQRYAVWNDWAEALASRFWPGPLTLVLPLRPDSPISERVTAGGTTIALRVPAHPVALQLIRAFDGGIAAPSANRSGRISPTCAAHVAEELGDAIPLIIDGGECGIGVESTVLDVSGESPRILRPGGVTRAMVEEVVEEVVSCQSSVVREIRGQRPEARGQRLEISKAAPLSSPVETLTTHDSRLTTHHSPLLSPGMLESHYAPTLPVRLNATHVAADEALLAFGKAPLQGAGVMLNLSESGNLEEAAAHVFAYLRALDAPQWRGIAVMPIPTEGIGEAIADRLKRAAAER